MPYGRGFVFDPSEPSSREKLKRISEESEASRSLIYPYLGGEDVTDRPDIDPSRRVIYTGQMSEGDLRDNYPAVYQHLTETIKPYRLTKSERIAKSPWWQFLWPRPKLYSRMRTLTRIIVTSRVSKHHAFAVTPSTVLPSTRVSVITEDRFGAFSLVQSRSHEMWGRFFGASRGVTANYSPSVCFVTFPFPPNFETDKTLEDIGQRYHDHRAALMIARNEGLTKTYNRFHDATERADDIETLRALHAEIDRAVLRAYGWEDLAARAAPVFLDETTEDEFTYQGRLFWPAEFRDEVLARLLALNAERHADEVRRGVAPAAGAKGGADEDGGEDGEDLL